MRYFIDAEFSERGWGCPIELISIAVVPERGMDFYACNLDFDPQHANDWVRQNVLPLLPPKPEFPFTGGAWMPYDRIGDELRSFVGPVPQFWGYYGAYDFVMLQQVMGGMELWPEGWPYIAYDLRQWLNHEALHHVCQPDDAPHDALEDARWIRDTFARYHLDRRQPDAP